MKLVLNIVEIVFYTAVIVYIVRRWTSERRSEHQRMRQKISKFPAPTPEFDSLPQPAATCGIPPRSAATCGDLRLESRIQNTESTLPPTPTGESGSVADAGFEQFCSAYPRQEAKASALKVWKRLNPDTDLIGCILEAIARRKQTDQWLRENGRFVPKPDKWLRDRRWEDVVQTQQEVRQLGDNLCQPTPAPQPWRDSKPSTIAPASRDAGGLTSLRTQTQTHPQIDLPSGLAQSLTGATQELCAEIHCHPGAILRHFSFKRF